MASAIHVDAAAVRQGRDATAVGAAFPAGHELGPVGAYRTVSKRQLAGLDEDAATLGEPADVYGRRVVVDHGGGLESQRPELAADATAYSIAGTAANEIVTYD
jgi:hypothetical protein